MNNDRYVTLRDIAKVCGVSQTTVSLALKNHPRISTATRQKVKQAAEELNYRQHPMLSALMANISKSRNPAAAAPLAALYTHAKSTIDGNDYHCKIWSGMEQRATELGVKLERFFFDQNEFTGKRITQILEARGIHGLIIPTFKLAGGDLDIDWSRFCSISVGYSMLSPNLHRVCPDQYRGIRMVLRELQSRGYTRPGLVLNRKSDVRTLQLWSSGFYGFEFSSNRKNVIPVLDCEEVTKGEFAEWYRTHKPDVIVSSDLEIVKPLQDAGLNFPEDVGLATLHLPESQSGCIAGIDQNENLIGAAAVEQLMQLMNYNEVGIPEYPRVLQIPSSWCSGESIRM